MALTEKQKQHRKARRLWVKALESGKFKWGTSALKTEEGKFCCLGVACEVAIKGGVIESYTPYAGTLSSVPSVMEWLGLDTTCGDFGDGGDDLTIINDGANRNPFKRIAKIIKSEPKGLFVD